MASSSLSLLLCRQKKMSEQISRNMGHFGSLTEISRTDFLTEVSTASKSNPVVVLLYQTALTSCQILARWLTQHAAPSNPTIKFVQIQSTRCIQNYPDENLPTILLYRLGNVQKQILNADPMKTKELIDQILEAEKEVK